jgi:hypothetical protein
MEFYFTMQSFDFAPPFVMPSGYSEIQNASPCPDEDPLSESVCLVESAGKGTGVVIAIRTDPITVGSCSIRALVLTAGHVTGRVLGIENDLSIKFGQTCFNAYLVKEFSDWKKWPQVDEITDNPYILPDDLALIGASDIMPRTKQAEIASDYAQGEPIWIVGFPRKPDPIECCAPFLKDDSERVKKIRRAFCNFQGGLVKSKGLVMSSSSGELISGSYSGMSGMSGSPVYSQTHKLVGINVGGAALELQHTVGQILSYAKEKDWESAKMCFESVKEQILCSPSFDSTRKELARSLAYFNVELGLKDYPQLAITASSLLKALAISYRTPLRLDHNLAISCKHRLFAQIQRCIEIFTTTEETHFRSMDDFIRFFSL